MKRVIIMTILGCLCISVSSCDKNDTITLIDPYDNSLAGSIVIYGHRITAEGSFDGIVLDNYIYDDSNLIISKRSDEEVLLTCFSKWGETSFKISIPMIIVSGKPHDVTFDISSNDTTVTYNDVEYTSVDATITGWIKNEYRYTCEITINCDVDGKILNLKITDVEP